jgi:long-chain acyl-CoA synthetase
LKIVDREKNLVKLSNGEYIAIEQIESKLSQSSYVRPNGLMVHADSDKDYLIALVLPQESQMKGKSGKGDSKIIEDEDFTNEVLESLQKESKKANLSAAETVKKVLVIDDEWTAENGMLSSAEKLKRGAIKEKYEEEIEALYNDEGGAKKSKKSEPKQKQKVEAQSAE